jgi:hypothetical protein
VSESRVLTRIIEPKMGEIIGGWRKLHNEEHNNSHPSPHIRRMVKSRRTRWEGYVSCMERRGMHTRFWWERQKEREYYKDLGIDGRTILKWISDK